MERKRARERGEEEETVEEGKGVVVERGSEKGHRKRGFREKKEGEGVRSDEEDLVPFSPHPAAHCHAPC